MRALALLALVLIGGVALFLAGMAIERKSRRPGVAMSIAAAIMSLVGLLNAWNGSWLLSSVFLAQGLIFAYEARQLRRHAREET